MKPIQLGDMRVHKVHEMDSPVPLLGQLPGTTSDDLVRLMRWYDQPDEINADPETALMTFSVHSWVIEIGGQTILIDTCCGNHKDRLLPEVHQLDTNYLGNLRAAGFAPEDIDMVMCTHLHFDHVGWNTYKDPETGAYKPTFPNARYLFGKTEYDAWQKTIRNDGHHSDTHLVECVDPIVAAGMADFIEADHRISPEVFCEPSHGHTPGHVHVCIDSQGRRAVITGDLMHHPMQCAMPQREATFDMDKEAGRQTRMGFVEKYADSGVVVIGAHFAEPTAGHIATGTDGARWFKGLGL